MTTKRNKKTQGLDLKKPVERPRMPFFVMLRMFLIGSVAVVASSYAIYRHYYVPRPSMRAPVSDAGPSPEPAGSDLLPVPELVPVPASSP